MHEKPMTKFEKIKTDTVNKLYDTDSPCY